MHGDLEPEEHHWPEPSHVNDLWEDMDRLNALYEAVSYTHLTLPTILLV